MLELDEPVEARSAAHRSRDRGWRVAKGIATTLAGRGVGALVPLILMPVTLSYLGPDTYGLWMAAAALTGMAAFVDLGLGNGLMTKVAPCYASGNADLARRYVSGAYATLTVVAAALCSLLWLMSSMVDWSSLLNATGTTSSDARWMTLVCLTAFVINVPLSLIVKVQYACQQVAQSNIWQAAGGLSALPLALIAVHAGLSPVAVVASTAAGPLLVSVVNNLWVYRCRLPELAPALRHVDRSVTVELLRLGGLFLVLTIVMSVAVNVDNLIVAHTLGLASVTAYAVPARLFAQVGLLVSVVNLPLWPANADALTRGQTAWVQQTTKRMSTLSLLTVFVPSALLVPGGDALLSLWLGESTQPGPWLLGGFALWWALLAAVSPRFMVQNASGVLRPQLVGWSLYVLISTPAKWYGAEHWGLAAIPYVGAAAYAMTVVPSAIVGYRRALSTSPARDAALADQEVPASI